jgi:transcriptional regulator with XRE-family HTH domain
LSSVLYDFCRTIQKMKGFREKLRDELDYQGLTVKELSEKSGIKKTTIDSYLGARESLPPIDIGVKLATALGISVEALVDDSLTNGKALYYIPEKYREIISDLSVLPSDIINGLKIQIHALAEAQRKKASEDGDKQTLA